jgi:hypothetical protein
MGIQASPKTSMNKKRKMYNLCEHLQELETYLLLLGGFDPVFPPRILLRHR